MKDVKEVQSGVLLGKFPCSECGSNDNLLVYVKHNDSGDEYLDGSCRTPSCKSFWTEKELKEANVLEEGFVVPKVKPVVKTAITKAEYKALIARTSHDTTQPNGSLYRGIKPETAEFYGHLYARDSEGNIIEEYYPETKEGFNGDLKSLRGYKKRVLPKDFGKGNIGITGLSNDFSGQHLFRKGGKYVVITGGEIDKLSVAQMLRDYQISRGQDDYDRTAVVSCTVGEGSLAKQCAANYEWLDLFDNIILCGDTDEVGRAAVIEAASKLPEDKVKIITLSMKDANEMLVAGKHKQFISNYFDAKPLASDGVKTSKQADDEIEEELGRPKVPLPPFMHSLQKAMAGGIPLGYMVNLGAVTGGGKCLGKDTPILMYDMSVKNVQDVVVGDLLMGDDGTPRTVLSTTSGQEQMYRVHQNKGDSYDVNASHILSLKAGYDTGSYVKGQVVNINIEEYLKLGVVNKRSLKGYKAKLTKFEGKGNTEEHAYLLGLWLAEGSSGGSRVTVHHELTGVLQNEVEKLGYELIVVAEDAHCTTYNIKGGFYKWLRLNGLLDNKHFPSWLLDCNRDTRIEVLSGYLDGDGYMHHNGYEVVAKQKALSDTFVTLCKSLGLRTSQRKVTKQAQNNFEGVHHKVLVYGDTWMLNLRLVRKQTIQSVKQPTGNTAITVEKLGVDTYYGFEIDGNRLFCLGDLTVTHNTTIINEMIYYWIFNSPVKIGILSLELTAGQYQTSLLSRHIGFKINLIEDPKEAVAFVKQPHVQEARRELRENEYGEERYVLLDERSGSLEAVKKQILKLIKKYSCQMIVIDPINDLFEGSNIEAQTDFIKFLKQIIKDGVSVFNVCHVTKGKTQVDKDGNVMMRQLTEDDFAGVTNLIKSGGCNIVAMRNKSETDEIKKNTTEVDILKCRWTGYTGFVGSWYYDPISHTLYDKRDFMEQQRSNF